MKKVVGKLFKAKLAKNGFINKEKACNFVESLGEPQDLLERSFFQYRYYKKLLGKTLSLAANLRSKSKINELIQSFRNNFREEENKIKADAVFFDPLGLPIIPFSVKQTYDILYLKDYNFAGMLSDDDIEYIDDVRKKYKKEPFFIAAIIRMTANYREIFCKYDIQAFIATDEIVFATTAMTSLCRHNGIKHIGVQHGNKHYEMSSMFFCFDEFYVWEDFFKNVCIELKAEKNQFIVEMPPCGKFGFDGLSHEDGVKTDYKFFLTLSTKKELSRLKKTAGILKQNGKTVLIRPHPRYTDLNIVDKYFDKSDIESPSEVDIEKSIFFTENIVSIDSSVLYQAYTSGKEVIIDDISNTASIIKLKNAGHIMYSETSCKLLSHELFAINNKKD